MERKDIINQAILNSGKGFTYNGQEYVKAISYLPVDGTWSMLPRIGRFLQINKVKRGWELAHSTRQCFWRWEHYTTLKQLLKSI